MLCRNHRNHVHIDSRIQHLKKYARLWGYLRPLYVTLKECFTLSHVPFKVHMDSMWSLYELYVKLMWNSCGILWNLSGTTATIFWSLNELMWNKWTFTGSPQEFQYLDST